TAFDQPGQLRSEAGDRGISLVHRDPQVILWYGPQAAVGSVEQRIDVGWNRSAFGGNNIPVPQRPTGAVAWQQFYELFADRGLAVDLSVEIARNVGPRLE